MRKVGMFLSSILKLEHGPILKAELEYEPILKLILHFQKSGVGLSI